jgi:hypothetical protein
VSYFLKYGAPAAGLGYFSMADHLASFLKYTASVCIKKEKVLQV